MASLVPAATPKCSNSKGSFRAEVESIIIPESNEDETFQELLVQLRIGVENNPSFQDCCFVNLKRRRTKPCEDGGRGENPPLCPAVPEPAEAVSPSAPPELSSTSCGTQGSV